MNGWIWLNKRVGVTSMDEIRDIRRALRNQYVQSNNEKNVSIHSFADQYIQSNNEKNVSIHSFADQYKNVTSYYVVDDQCYVSKTNIKQDQDCHVHGNVCKTKLKVGHAGTLDPFATGVLPIAIGEATKLIPLFEDMDKEYKFEMTFGSRTDTGDLTGNVIDSNDLVPTENILRNILHQFIGEISQVPHKVSAIKVNGQRAYDLFRKGQMFQLQARKVHIYELKLLSYSNGHAELSVRCSKGTYVRSLCEDIAHALDMLAHVSKLERTQYGPISVSMTQNQNVLPMNIILEHVKHVIVSEEQAKLLRHGQMVHIEHDDVASCVAVVNQDIIGLIEITDRLMRVQRLIV